MQTDTCVFTSKKNSPASLKNSSDVSVPSARFSNYGKQRRPPYLLQTLPFPLLDDHQAIGLAGVGLSGAALLMMILMVLMILMTISKNLHFSTMCFQTAPLHRCLAANLRIGIFNCNGEFVFNRLLGYVWLDLDDFFMETHMKLGFQRNAGKIAL